MLLMASTVLIVYGFLQLQLKELWWFDTMVTARFFGRALIRTDAWDKRHDRRGVAMMAVGGVLLILWALTVPL